MARHIGIVACSAEGASLCYRTICGEGAAVLGGYSHPEVSMHTPPLAKYVTCLEQGDWAGVADLMLASTHKLAAMGADFVVCPDNTIHGAFNLVAPRSPLPWLHIAEVVADEAVERGYQRVAVTGTQWLVDSDVYPAALAARGVGCTTPDAAARREMNRIIMSQLVHGVFTPAAVVWFQALMERLKREGACQAVVLGCTEIPLLMDDTNSPLPTLDSTRLLARAALRHSMSSDASLRGGRV